VRSKAAPAAAAAAPASPADNDSPERDAKALELRSKGRSFAQVARTLGYEKARDANLAFNRALRRLPETEMAEARRAEGERLDTLVARINGAEDLAADEVTRQLRVVERLRDRLLAD
jgi:hypothetical protein